MSVHNWVIYQILDSRGAGGIESHVFNLSRWLNDNGFHNEVIFLKDYGPHQLKEDLTAEGINWQCLSSYSDLNRKLTHFPCLLCTHGYKAGIVGRFLGWWHKAPVVSTYHSGDRGQGKLKLYSWLDEISSILADRVISVSNEISARLPVASQQIVNFVPKQPISPVRGNAIAYVGRLSEEKNPHSFARATRDIGLPCHIYGDGPLKRELQQNYSHLKLFGHVEMERHWKDIGLLCITSRHEGLPLAALEAMVRGIPVISYAVGGLPNLIENRYNGWLVPPGDENTLQKLIRLWTLKSSTEKAAMSVAAHHHIVKHFCDEVICPQIINLYQQAIQHRGHLLIRP